MFGLSLPTLTPVRGMSKIDPKDIPEPTPIVFPRPPTPTPDQTGSEPRAATATGPGFKGLVSTLQAIHRPNDIKSDHFDALGLRTRYDAEPSELLPDPSYLPDFDAWDKLTIDQAREQNHDTKLPLNNGNLSPGCQVYRERKAELSTANQDAFRTVRRLPVPKGKNPVRLGNSYEFFRCLELLTPYWDDPTAPHQPPATQLSPEPSIETPDEAMSEKVSDERKWGSTRPQEAGVEYRTLAGTAMPPENRHSLLSSFIKLVAYDFGCNVSTPRSEPRLHLRAPPSNGAQALPPRKSYISSGCIFVFRSATKREHARAGIIDGPVAAVSARATTGFSADTERNQDLARELIAGFVTAQHRAREGRAEKRFGEGEWWTTKKRWGGGSGGPIGREAEAEEAAAAAKDGASPPIKKPRKTMSMYDNYRMVRPPALNWDKKTRYEAIGRIVGEDFDDVFVLSSLFHHVSVLRIRIPRRLLDVFEGAEEKEGMSWGELRLWRSKWFDLFVGEERVEAMKLLWGVFAYQMRRVVPPSSPEGK